MALLRLLCLVLLLALPREGAAQAETDSLAPVPLADLRAFAPADPTWEIAGGAWTLWDSTALATEPGTGVLVHRGGTAPIATAWEHGDLILELEYLLPKGADSGLLLQGRYEVQLTDSWGVSRPRHADAGGIDSRLDPASGAEIEGHPPRANASLAPGLWQHLRLVFQAPRFDAAGRKTEPARVVEVIHNGVKVQENVAVNGPTRAALYADEAPAGPLVIQGGSPVAVRHFRYRHYAPVEPVTLTDVHFAYYPGEFSSLDELQDAVPEQAGGTYGFVWDLFGIRADRFGLAWEGMLHAPRSGEYVFEIGFNWIDDIPYDEDAVPGEGRLTIGGQEVVFHDGSEHAMRGRIHLEEGAHPFYLAYFKNRRLWRPIVFFNVEGPEMAPTLLNAPRTVPPPESSSPFMPLEPAGEPVVQRSFVEIDGVKHVNALSVGDPRGIHYTLDLDAGGLLYAWRGDFLDVGSMWHARGEGQLARPLGYAVLLADGPSVAALGAPGEAWPDSAAAGYRFDGYTVDEAGLPTLRYELGDVSVTERLTPTAGGRGLLRQLTVSGTRPAETLWLRAAEGETIREHRPGVYAVDGRYFIALERPAGAARIVATPEGRRELRVAVPAGPRPADLAYTILW